MDTATSVLQGRRVAIIHFTGPAAVGGIESLIAAQTGCLQAWGVDVRPIVGSGVGSEAESILLPMIHPATLAAEIGEMCGFPTAQHPVVRLLVRDLRTALTGCTDCWVHNAFTVFLNPFLTVALRVLAAERSEMRWVAWCEDISSTSAYWDTPDRASVPALMGELSGVSYVTISEARRQELAPLIGRPARDILVIPPPVDALDLLGIGPRVQELAVTLQMDCAMPVVVVPAKLLPHKNLHKCVGITAALREHVARPLVLITGAPSPHERERSRQIASDLCRHVLEAGIGDSLFLISHLWGELGHGDVRDLMALSDVILLPSTEEGYGLPLQEAAALRVPVLSSRIPVFEEAGVGHYFDAEQSDREIAGMILEMANTRENLARRRTLRSQSRFHTQLANLLAVSSDGVHTGDYRIAGS